MFNKKKRIDTPVDESLPDGIAGTGWEVSVQSSTGYYWKWELFRDGRRVSHGSYHGTHDDVVEEAKRDKKHILKNEAELSKPRIVSL